MKAVVVGLGLIGGSLAFDLRKESFASRIGGVDASPEYAKTALKLGIVDSIGKLEEALPSADLVVLAIPVDAICALAGQVLDLVSANAAVTDMGSTKSPIERVLGNHAKRAQFVLSHPMAGTENSGPEAALSGLFRGRTGVICDREKNDPSSLATIEKMYRTIGMRMVYMTAQEHDLHVAYVSHLSHISSFVLANTVLAKEKNVNTIFDLAGGGFQSTVRLAKSSPEMWAPIFEQNLKNVSEAVQSYIEHLQAFQRTLQEQNFTETARLMKEANKIRRVLEDIGKGTENG